MEFIKFDEAANALQEMGIEAFLEDEDHMHLSAVIEAGEAEPPCFLHFADAACPTPADNDARVIEVGRDELAAAVENMIGQLGLSQLLVVPVGKWRSVFDAVAFSMAANPDWQEIDAMATVELNTRDPLLCEPADFHTLIALIRALFTDAESADQGLTIASTARTFIAEVVPAGCVRVTVGNQVMVDEIVDGMRI